MQAGKAWIFAAEVLGHRSRSEIKEDELTSRVIGIFAHLSSDGQLKWLSSLGLGIDVQDLVPVEVEFWPSMKEADRQRVPDAKIKGPKRSLVLEFKWSGERSKEQLIGERRALESPEDVLGFVTPDFITPQEVETAEKELGLSRGSIIYISWNRLLKGAKEARDLVDDSRDKLLLTEVISLLEVLGVSDWSLDLNEYAEIMREGLVFKVFNGLKEYFQEVYKHLQKKHSARYNVGQPQMSFGGETYMEFTSKKLKPHLGGGLATYLYYNHKTGEWSLILRARRGYGQSLKAWEQLKERELKNIRPVDPNGDSHRAAARREFQPRHGFEEPEKLRDEMENAVLGFADDISAALSK